MNKLKTLTQPPEGSRLYQHYACLGGSDYEMLIIFPPNSGVLSVVGTKMIVEKTCPLFQGTYEKDGEYLFTEGNIKLIDDEISFNHIQHFKASSQEDSLHLHGYFLEMIRKFPPLCTNNLMITIRSYYDQRKREW